jgi:hypothetical protein
VQFEADALRQYASAAAHAFGIGPDRSPKFLKERAQRDVQGDPGAGTRRGRRTRATAEPGAGAPPER